MFSGCFFELNLLGIVGTNDTMYSGKDPWKFRGFRDENKGEYSRIFWARSLAPLLPERHKISSKFFSSSVSCHKSSS